MEDKTVDFKNDPTAPDAAEKTASAAAPAPKVSQRLKKALIRCGVALAVLIALLAVTHFSAFQLIKGPEHSTSLKDEKQGAFVRRDVYAIFGYSEDEKSGDTVTGEYAVVEMDNQFVTVHLPRRYLSSADAVLTETKSYLSGNSSTLDKYFVVDGCVEKLTDAQKKKLNDWYTANRDWMVKENVISESSDASTYLSDVILEVDQIGGMSQLAVIILSGIAGVLLLYVIVELILMASGFYLDDSVKSKLKNADWAACGADGDSEATEAEAQDADEGSTENETENDAENAADAPAADTPADSQPEDKA